MAVATWDDEAEHFDEIDEDVRQYADALLSGALRNELLYSAEELQEANVHSSDRSLEESGEQNVWDLPMDHEDPKFEALGSEPMIQQPVTREQPYVPKTKRSALEILEKFDPQNPPESGDMEELQLWLECEAQQESLWKYQKVVDAARDRKNYASMSVMQKQVSRWFDPVRDAIKQRQQAYLKIKPDETRRLGSIRKWGPYLCALPPEKLAIIACHEAIVFTTINSTKAGTKGMHTLVSVARAIGEAVEAEVAIHRHLRRRALEERRLARERSETKFPIPHLNNEEEEEEEEEDQEDSLLEEELDSKPSSDVDGVVEIEKWAYTASHLKSYLEEVNNDPTKRSSTRTVKKAIRLAKSFYGRDEDWPLELVVQIGAVLLQILLEHATISNCGRTEMAFRLERKWVKDNRNTSFVALHDSLFKMLTEDKFQSIGAATTRYKPMIVPPSNWTEPEKGGYRWLKSELIRYHGCKVQKEALLEADLSTVYDGLNTLGRVPWKINRKILDVAQYCWDNNIALGDIPSQTDFEVPPEPERLEIALSHLEKGSTAFKAAVEEIRAYQDALGKHRRLKQKNMDLRSLRCSALLKLDQAEKFSGFDEIFFPYNMDFRGRAYPVPPHLSNVGSDLCRGVLKFAEAKPLGPRGLYWLKVHLANFAGMDKISFDDRAAFVEDNLHNVRASVEDPFGDNPWWMTLEDPFQGLATCHEIVNAIDSGDPESYRCSLPVHMDGSCNGLQHYAALGRDKVGGKAVNLCDQDEPQDVYVGVMEEVIRRVAEESERELDFSSEDYEKLSKEQRKALRHNKAAKLVNGLIDRGVVKRTVMTSVYGVTYIGARQQIQEKIISKLEGLGHDIDDIQNECFQACGYLASVTMEVMGELFTGAKETMNWLTCCARLICKHGQPVAWMSAIGIPAIQPYRQTKASTVVTVLQHASVMNNSDDMPINKRRQVTAFPPNFVHSLDSSHMLLTALEMDRRGLTFSAVHDSFWTHACNIDEMNEALRECFVDLYSRPLLEELKESWEFRYPEIEFPPLPERGDLDLEEVKSARYFFQ